VLNINQNPLLVDTGISTYKKNQRRKLERSTCSHNTVTVNGYNSSDVWGGFRVARKARTKIIHGNNNMVLAYHNGYSFENIKHFREWKFSENIIFIKDTLKGKKSANGIAHYHFNHTWNPLLTENKIYIKDTLFMEFNHAEHIQLKFYKQACGFNILKKSRKVEVHFKNNLKTYIYC
jgi:hypothetical protein